MVRVFDSSANWLLRRVGIEPVEELHHGATLEELGHVIGESEAHGSLPPHLSGLLAGPDVLRSDRCSGHGPRPASSASAPTDPPPRLIELIAEAATPTTPSSGGGTDEVWASSGCVSWCRLPVDGVRHAASDRSPGPRCWCRRPPACQAWSRGCGSRPTSSPAWSTSTADWPGSSPSRTSAEELVGEIVDENDTQAAFATQAGDWWHVDAARRTDEITERTGIELPAGQHYDTVAGMIVAMMGRLVSAGDRLVVPATPESGAPAIEVEVLTVDRRVPGQVRLRVAQPLRVTRTEVARA